MRREDGPRISFLAEHVRGGVSGSCVGLVLMYCRPVQPMKEKIFFYAGPFDDDESEGDAPDAGDVNDGDGDDLEFEEN